VEKACLSKSQLFTHYSMSMNRNPSLYAMVVCLLALSAVSCDNRSALDNRMDELRYTMDSLSDAIATRLVALGDNAKMRASKPNSRGEDVDAGRSAVAEDSRPDPNSLESVVLETLAKFDNIDPRRNKAEMLDELIEKLRTSGKVDVKVVESFQSAVQTSLKSR
jgi:hypothetical protein